MKSILPVSALVSVASAHYTLPSMSLGGQTTAAWAAVRQWKGYQSNAPVTNVASQDIQCNVGASSPVASATQSLAAAAGSTIDFNVTPAIYHTGPSMVYLARVPDGYTSKTWTPSGNVWFKVAEYGVKSFNPFTFITDNASKISFTIPQTMLAGEYIARVEQIGLHSASATNGAQFYISCGQLTVTGGGSSLPDSSSLVSFPGAYKATDPGLLINVYYPLPKTYTMPGPAVWTC